MSSVTCAITSARSRVSHPRMNSRTTFSLRSTIGSIEVIGVVSPATRPSDMQRRTAVLKPELVVEIIAPTADFPVCIEVEHSDAWQLQTPSATIEIPTIEPFRANRVTAPKDFQQFPLDFPGALEDALDYLANVCGSNHGFERLIDI